jgi:hypothetical protein
MKKSILTALMAFSILTLAEAQDYKTGIGLRAGLSQGLTVKHFFSGKAAFEGLISARYENLEITGLFEIHNQAFDVRRLNWFYGFGAHIGFRDEHHDWKYEHTTYTTAGIDGILGIEYNFEEIPINLGVDWKPYINLNGYYGLHADGGAFSIRYIF